MSKKNLVVMLTSAALLMGCASGISNRQKMDLDTYEARGLAVHEKSPGAAAALGILPGGGSFYGREYALGVVNLLFWPLSICWDPVSGYNAANRINYIETKHHVETLKNKETNELNLKRVNGLIDDYTYSMEMANISQKYDLNPVSQPLMVAPVYRAAPVRTVEQSAKDQQVEALKRQNLPYEEYQRRYNEIMAQ